MFAELTQPTTELPRAKPLPKPKEKTKWEQFAQTKGIQKRKRSLKEWDEGQQDFVVRHGLGSAKNDKMRDWIVELPDNGTGFEVRPDTVFLLLCSVADSHRQDPRAEARAAKKKALHKQEKQRQANKGRAAAKGMRKMPGSESVALLTGGASSTMNRKQLKETIRSQMGVTKKVSVRRGGARCHAC